MNHRTATSTMSLQCREPNGFTLVEVLVALTLTVLVVGVAGRMAIQLTVAGNFVEAEAERVNRDHLLQDQLGQDLSGLEIRESADALLLFGAPQQTLQLQVLSDAPWTGASLHAPRLPATVRYSLDSAGMRDAALRLVRETIDRTDASATPRRETVASDLVEWRMEVLVGREWMSHYPAQTAPKNQNLRALRASWRWSDTERTVSQTFGLDHEN